MAQSELQTLRVGAGAAGFNFLPIFLARHRGIFADLGLCVEVVRTGSTDKATAALKAGELDIALTPPEGALADAVAGGPLRIIAGNLNGLPLSLIANPRFLNIAALKGASLGTSSMTEGTALYTMEILAGHGLHYPGDYEFKVVGVHTARWEALKAGTLDAAVQLVPLNFVAEDEGYRNLGEASDTIPDIAFISVIARADWLGAQPDTVEAFLRGLAEGTRLLYDRTNDAEVCALAADEIKIEPRYVVKSLDLVLGKRMMPLDLSVPEPALSTSIALMVKAGLLEAANADKAKAVLDDSYRRRALSERG